MIFIVMIYNVNKIKCVQTILCFSLQNEIIAFRVFSGRSSCLSVWTALASKTLKPVLCGFWSSCGSASSVPSKLPSSATATAPANTGLPTADGLDCLLLLRLLLRVEGLLEVAGEPMYALAPLLRRSLAIASRATRFGVAIAVATSLVKKGTLRVGDIFAAGGTYGRVRALIDTNDGKTRLKVTTF